MLLWGRRVEHDGDITTKAATAPENRSSGSVDTIGSARRRDVMVVMMTTA